MTTTINQQNNTMNSTTEQQEVQPVKIQRDKSGRFVRAEKVKKERKEGLKLTCTVTGKSRPTNQKYLDAKAQRLGVSVEELIKGYVSKEGLASLTEDHPRYQELLKMNGKQRQKKEKEELVEA